MLLFVPLGSDKVTEIPQILCQIFSHPDQLILAMQYSLVVQTKLFHQVTTGDTGDWERATYRNHFCEPQVQFLLASKER
ncbi:hypothetical protein AB6A40_001111 [Gnathostoma spinigerum]|uniref:Uncharacterized protein n=1 Tax=Gnathostoma spinigerum TaxID=75299 RepID=A0ABD6ECI5_9BILA